MQGPPREAEPAPRPDAQAADGRRFDPATGAWRQHPAAAPGQAPPAAPSPAAPAPEARKHTAGARAWDIVLGLTLAAMALLFVVSAVPGLLEAFGLAEPSNGTADEGREGEEGAGEEGGEGEEGDGADGGLDPRERRDLRLALHVQNAVLFTAMAVVPLAWGFGTRVVPFEGTVRFFRLRPFWPDFGKGLLWALAVLAGVAAVGTLAVKLDESQGTDLADNPVLDDIRSVMTWPLALGMALAAGIGEEVLFRGFLQRKIGFWGQAVVFGLSHASYGTALQVILPFLLALLFGWMVRRGASLWMPIAAHAAYDFVVLSAVLWGA